MSVWKILRRSDIVGIHNILYKVMFIQGCRVSTNTKFKSIIYNSFLLIPIGKLKRKKIFLLPRYILTLVKKRFESMRDMILYRCTYKFNIFTLKIDVDLHSSAVVKLKKKTIIWIKLHKFDHTFIYIYIIYMVTHQFPRSVGRYIIVWINVFFSYK